MDALDRIRMSYPCGMLGQTLTSSSIDAGDRFMLATAAAEPVKSWPERSFTRRAEHDALGRLTHVYVEDGVDEELVNRLVHGETHADLADDHTKGRLVQHYDYDYDQSGALITDEYDRNGNLATRTRRLATDYQNGLSWSHAGHDMSRGDDAEDALTAAATTPESETTDHASTYDETSDATYACEADLLEATGVNLRGSCTATPIVTNIDYDPHGQREKLTYDNRTETTHTYDELSPHSRSSTRVPETDPVYTYDAVYRHVQATRREHEAIPRDHAQLRTYTREHAYDPAGNITQMKHTPDGTRPGRAPWTSNYEEYHPYGTSAYRAMKSGVEVSARRYRYTGKERDDETGLYLMGARYYACWLARWTAADPAGTVDGTNLYAYVRGSPVGLVDPSGTQAADDDYHAGKSAVVEWGALNKKEATRNVGTKKSTPNPKGQKTTSRPRMPSPSELIAALEASEAEMQEALSQGPPVTPESKSPVKDFLGDLAVGAIFGDFTPDGNVTAGTIIGSIAVGFTPAGVVADVRDIGAALKGVSEGKEGAWGDLALASVGVVPGVGDAAKAIAKTGLQGVGAAVVTGLRKVAKGTEARKLLVKALDAAGGHKFPKEAAAEAHHIFGVHLFDGPLGQKLQNWGIDLNGAENGVYLPRYDFDGRQASIHRGKHTNAYNDYVQERLGEAQSKEDALEILADIKDELLKGDRTLNNADVTKRRRPK